MQFKRRRAAVRLSADDSGPRRDPGNDAVARVRRATVPAVSLCVLLALGLLPSPIRIVAGAEAQTCTPPAFWNPFHPGGGRCEVLLCAEGWTRDNNICRNGSNFPAYAASCAVGSGVRAVDYGAGNYGMLCVEPSEPPSSRPDPAPPGTIEPADPPTAPVDATRVQPLPFTASESGSGEKSYRFRLETRTEVSVSLTGMDRDIDCRVNGSSCTNRGGRSDDSWSGRLGAGTHTVTVYPYGGGSGSWTLGVSGTVTSSPPPLDPAPGACPAGYDHDAVANRCVREAPFQMTASRTGVSGGQSYSFDLPTGSSVSVALTGMTRDFDCRVNGSRCTNNWGTADDSWSGRLGASTHTVEVYPYGRGGPGDYTLTVGVDDVSLVSIVQPFGAPETEDDETCTLDGEEIECPTPDETLDVVGEHPGPPLEEPDGTTPPETDPPPQPPDPGDGGGPPGSGNPPSWVTPEMEQQLADAVADAITRSRTCSVITIGGQILNAHAKLSSARTDYGGLGCGSGDTSATAYVIEPATQADTIYICPAFFPGTEIERSGTIMHEGLHMAGASHEHFLDGNGQPADPEDGGPMNTAITVACYAQ